MSQFLRQAFVTLDLGDGTQLNIADLNVSFKIFKSLDRTANTTEVSIFNLSESTRDRIKEVDDTITLVAGYQDQVGILTVAKVTRVLTEHNQPDIVTRVEAMDGVDKIRQVRNSLSFEPGTPVKEALLTVIDKLGLPKKSFDIPSIDTLKNGFSFSGRTTDALNKLAERLGLDWSIQNDELQVIDKAGTNQNPVVKLSPKTGLIGSPEKLTQVSGQLNNTAADRGYKVRCLLNHLIEPGGKLELDSNLIKGTFKISTVSHTGELRGSDWFTIADVVRL